MLPVSDTGTRCNGNMLRSAQGEAVSLRAEFDNVYYAYVVSRNNYFPLSCNAEPRMVLDDIMVTANRATSPKALSLSSCKFLHIHKKLYSGKRDFRL